MGQVDPKFRMTLSIAAGFIAAGMIESKCTVHP
jgi:hypothetical protein